MKGVIMKILTKLWKTMCDHKIATVIMMGLFLGVFCAIDMLWIGKPVHYMFGTVTFEKWMALVHCLGMSALVGVVNGLVITS